MFFGLAALRVWTGVFFLLDGVDAYRVEGVPEQAPTVKAEVMKIVGCMCMGADPEPRELYLGYNSTSGPAGQCVIGYRFWTRLWHRVVVVLVKFSCRECWICEVIVTTHLSNLNTTTNLSQQNVRYWYRLNLNFDFHNERSRNSEIFIQKNLIWRLYTTWIKTKLKLKPVPMYVKSIFVLTHLVSVFSTTTYPPFFTHNYYSHLSTILY